MNWFRVRLLTHVPSSDVSSHASATRPIALSKARREDDDDGEEEDEEDKVVVVVATAAVEV